MARREKLWLREGSGFCSEIPKGAFVGGGGGRYRQTKSVYISKRELLGVFFWGPSWGARFISNPSPPKTRPLQLGVRFCRAVLQTGRKRCFSAFAQLNTKHPLANSLSILEGGKPMRTFCSESPSTSFVNISLGMFSTTCFV